jgi:hypothetical protein
LANVEVRRVSALHDFRLRVGESVNDPVYLLMSADRKSIEIRAARGVAVELAFSMGTARVVSAAQGQHDTPALDQKTA